MAAAAAHRAKKNAELRTKKSRPTSFFVIMKVSGISIAADCVPVDEDLKLWITNRDQAMTAVWSWNIDTNTFEYLAEVTFFTISIPLLEVQLLSSSSSTNKKRKKVRNSLDKALSYIVLRDVRMQQSKTMKVLKGLSEIEKAKKYQNYTTNFIDVGTVITGSTSSSRSSSSSSNDWLKIDFKKLLQLDIFVNTWLNTQTSAMNAFRSEFENLINFRIMLQQQQQNDDREEEEDSEEEDEQKHYYTSRSPRTPRSSISSNRSPVYSSDENSDNHTNDSFSNTATATATATNSNSNSSDTKLYILTRLHLHNVQLKMIGIPVPDESNSNGHMIQYNMNAFNLWNRRTKDVNKIISTKQKEKVKEEESSTPPTSLGHSGMEAYVAIEGILLSVEPKNKNKRNTGGIQGEIGIRCIDVVGLRAPMDDVHTTAATNKRKYVRWQREWLENKNHLHWYGISVSILRFIEVFFLGF